jgi:hypothetical protein
LNPSGSSLERAVNCPAAFALPRAGHTGEAAIRGTENHDKIEGGLSLGGDLSHLPDVVRKAMDGALSVDVEVAFAIDIEKETVRVIGQRLGRNYGPLTDSEIPLTLDAIITKRSGVEVWDWKSRKRVTASKHNLQLRAGAVAVMKTRGVSEVLAALGYLDNSESDEATVDSFDEAAFFADMRAAMNKIGAARTLVASGGTPEVHSGPWCDYCPAMAYCPAHTRLALNMLGELEDIKGKVAFMTVEQVSKAWDIKKRLESMLETVDESLRLRISQEFIPRANGKRLALVDCKRTSDDTKRMKDRLVELGEDLNAYRRTVEYTQVKEINAGKE